VLVIVLQRKSGQERKKLKESLFSKLEGG